VIYELLVNLVVLAVCAATAWYLVLAWRRERESRLAFLFACALALSLAAFVAWIGVVATWAYSSPVLVAFLVLLAAAGVGWVALAVAAIGRAVSR
jgi:hypothetical protein